MAEERTNNTEREGRRRYFRRRQRGPQGQGTPTESREAPPKRPVERNTASPANERGLRTNRRRRRTRNRTAPPPNGRSEPTVTESITDLSNYTPPKAVFIYTYVTRPASRDSYEFRSEHFSKVGRQLEDYEIDLSSLYPATEETDERSSA
jgi:hypothetical protein